MSELNIRRLLQSNYELSIGEIILNTKTSNNRNMNPEIPLERYSIWLMPKDEVYDILKSTIQELSKKYKTPPFEPHITLLGNTKSNTEPEAIRKTKKIARTVKEFQIELKEIDY